MDVDRIDLFNLRVAESISGSNISADNTCKLWSSSISAHRVADGTQVLENLSTLIGISSGLAAIAFRFAIDEYESDYNIEQFTEDLQMIKGDLEAVLNELAK